MDEKDRLEGNSDLVEGETDLLKDNSDIIESEINLRLYPTLSIYPSSTLFLTV